VRLVITHEQPDFDAVASAALATVLIPGSTVALAGTQPGSVGELLKLYRDQVPMVDTEDVDLRAVTELIVVDTAERGRLGRFRPLLDELPVTVFDHHPEPSDPVPGSRGLRDTVGATVTLLARQLAAAGVSLPAALASLALLGLHEDTGDLTFDHTTADDHQAAAWLLQQGANLEVVRRFRSATLPPELSRLRERLLSESRTRDVAGRSVVTVSFTRRDYLPSASGLANTLLDDTGADAVVIAARMADRTLVFARSGSHVDVAGTLQQALGGGGHRRAAFARCELPPESALERVLEAMTHFVDAPLRARDVMSTPVRTLQAASTLAEARQELARYRHNGMPVVDDGGRLVGVISRRDLDHALKHGIADAQVQGFMTRPAVTAAPESTLRELERLVLRHDVGRLPIVADDELVGIVTRSDLIRARHPGADLRAPAERVLASLPEGARRVLDLAASLAAGAHLYLVGGTVRDGLMGVGYQDLDLVVVAGAPAASPAGVAGAAATGVAGAEPGHAAHAGSRGAPSLGRALQRVLGGSLAVHSDFGTATLRLEGGLVVDLASARAEAYPAPGALPEVRSGRLVDDLARRDFSVNALAVRFHPPPADLIDPFGGLADLEQRRLRVLHPLSFVEDPTRLVRGARLAGRLGMRFDDDALAKARAALRPEVLANVSGQRLRGELELTLSEPRVAPALRQLAAFGALGPLYGLELDAAALERLDAAAREAPRRGDESAPGAAAGLMVLLCATPDGDAARAFERFHWPRRLWLQRERVLALAQGTLVLTGERLAALEPSSRRALAALAPALESAVAAFEHAPERPRLRGRDVLRLGLAAGPPVGAVLDEVARAREAGEVLSFEDELALAERLVRERQHSGAGERQPRGASRATDETSS
jgi:tRNA nucleotidyltransferase (CCA-adding enzyme)